MLNHEVERKVMAILKVLSTAQEPLGARMISRQLESFGVNLTERAVRYHLQLLDERGLTINNGKEGRLITEKGIEEISNALVTDKVGLVINKIDTLSYRTTFDLNTRKGKIILNTSLFAAHNFRKAVEAMHDVFAAQHCVSDLVAVAEEGQMLGDILIPKGYVGFGTICSVTINGIFLRSGIPVESKFGGILQVKESKPRRFTDLISYAGSSLDPLEVFIRSKMTSVRSAAKDGEGKILASFREVPAICLPAVETVLAKINRVGLRGLVTLGHPGRELLEVAVGINRVGMVIIGGLNPLAAAEEAGIPSENRAMSTMFDFDALRSYGDL
ncbi:MAG: NrpR regulatory domain-containing protein [Chloroflexi bacterium]|nr:NrpR regulatory domain-containing protein [Chloroflexota bacterium]MDA8189156.1 NrpR regulatory domain-containing protein [Dehalococcoidales bacterium]